MIDLRRMFARAPAPPPAGVFGFAVVGLGRIAEHFLAGVADSSTVRATALVSGDADKAARLAAKHAVPHVCGYAEFDRLLQERDDVHAVYVALPVSMHAEFTARAAEAGKHVLVEKPMASTAAECRTMIAACRDAGVLLSVAYRCPYDPMHRRALELLREGAIGTLERVESSFGFALSADDWRRNGPLAGGGSLFDVGIYPLNAARYFVGEEPTGQTARATTDGNGMELAIDWTSTFPGGVEAHCRSSYKESLAGDFVLHGSAGTLRLDPAFTHREAIRLRGTVTEPDGRRATVDERSPRETPSHFRLEAEALAASVRKGATLPTPGEEGLRDMEAMERIYAAAGVGVPAAYKV